MGTVVLDELEELMRKKFEHAPGQWVVSDLNRSSADSTGINFQVHLPSLPEMLALERLMRRIVVRSSAGRSCEPPDCCDPSQRH